MRYDMSEDSDEHCNSERFDTNSQNKVPVKNSIFCVEGLCDSVTIFSKNLNLGDVSKPEEIKPSMKKEFNTEATYPENVVIKEEVFESQNVSIIDDNLRFGTEEVSEEVLQQFPTCDYSSEKEMNCNLIDVKQEIAEKFGGGSSSLMLELIEDKMLSTKKIKSTKHEKPFKCPHCPYQASHKGNFQNHLKTHTGEKPFECSYCPYQASLKGNLQNHLRTHTGEKPFKCNHCPYQASQKGTLQNHLRAHTGEKRNKSRKSEKVFECSYCPYQASLKVNLQNHLRTHTGEKPFKCIYCPYQASQKGTLQNHLRTHTGERPYKCGHCPYTASRKGNYQNHLKIHSGEKPFKCNHCPYEASHKVYLKRHLRRHKSPSPQMILPLT